MCGRGRKEKKTGGRRRCVREGDDTKVRGRDPMRAPARPEGECDDRESEVSGGVQL